MDIGEVSQRSGVAPSTLRYYEEVGLIKSTGRNGLRRQFNDSVLDQLAIISLARIAGFNLEEISSLFNTTKGVTKINREKLKSKADEIDKKMARLAAIRENLLHASVCKAPSHLECPTFQRLMKAVVKEKTIKRKKT